MRLDGIVELQCSIHNSRNTKKVYLTTIVIVHLLKTVCDGLFTYLFTTAKELNCH